MATSKTLTPTNVTIQIPAFTDQPDQRVNSNCIDKEADAINALNSKIATHDKGIVSVTPATGVTVDVGGAKSADVKYLRFTISDTSLTYAKEICTVPSAWYPVASRPYFPALNNDTGALMGMFILNINGKLMYYGTSTSNTVVCCGLYI